MRSTMMETPLQIHRLLEHGSRLHADSQLVTATEDGSRTTTFAEAGRQAAGLAHALRALGIDGDQRVGTFMWNNAEHVVTYLAVPAMGAVLHPINIRLPGQQIVYTVADADDQVVIVDNSLVPGFTELLPHLPTLCHVVVNGPADLSPLRAAAPDGVQVHEWDTLLEGRPTTFEWPDVDENDAAAINYTSGTTGDPRGVAFSHRSVVLHALSVAVPDMFGLSAADQLLVVVPQFHVLAWGTPYTAIVTGTSLALPDRFLAPEPLAAFIAHARPNRGAGVPTVWGGLAQLAASAPEQVDLSSLEELVVGGSAMSASLMDTYDALGIRLVHAWGMTETSPLGALSRPPVGASAADARAYRLRQGTFPALVEARLTDPADEELPWDGESVGELEVRGPWITGSYLGGHDTDRFHDGWLRTGDVGHVTPDGYLQLTDRVKDIIKSGGEWISSVELEGQLMAHTAVAEASVVGVPDETWGERPLATVVLERGQSVTPEELRAFLADRVPRWQLPERWAFIEEVPKTSVGKFDKKALRAAYADGELDVTDQR